jgi:hypothetical protein
MVSIAPPPPPNVISQVTLMTLYIIKLRPQQRGQAKKFQSHGVLGYNVTWIREQKSMPPLKSSRSSQYIQQVGVPTSGVKAVGLCKQ